MNHKNQSNAVLPQATPEPTQLFTRFFLPFLALCALAYLPLTLIKGIYWDDWIYARLAHVGDFKLMWKAAHEVSNDNQTLLYVLISRFSNVYVAARALQYLGSILATLSFYWVLCLHRWRDETSRRLVALLFAFQTNYLCYIPAGMLHYHSAFGAFGLGFFLHGAAWADPAASRATRNILRVLAWGCFYFAFSIHNGFLPFFLAAFSLHSYLLLRKSAPGAPFLDRGLLWRWLKTEGAMLAVVPLYWILKKPIESEVEPTYNAIRLDPGTLFTGYWRTFVDDIIPSLTWPFRALVADPAVFAYLVPLAIAAWFLFQIREKNNQAEEPGSVAPGRNETLWMIGLGVAAVAIAALPSVAVTRPANYRDLESRFGMIFPVGQSVVVAAVLLTFRRFLGRKPWLAIVSLIVAVYGAFVMNNFRSWDVDWYKEEAIIEQARFRQEIRDASTVIFEDHLPDLNAMSRTYRNYDYAGWLILAYGTQNHMALPPWEDPRRFQWTKPLMNDYYDLLDSYDASKPWIGVRILRGPVDLHSFGTYLKLKWLELTDLDAHRALVRDAVVLESGAVQRR